MDKLLEDRISEDPNVIIEPSNFQHTENVKPNDNIVQSSDIREGPFDKEKFDASTMKKVSTIYFKFVLMLRILIFIISD